MCCVLRKYDRGLTNCVTSCGGRLFCRAYADYVLCTRNKRAVLFLIALRHVGR
jgi:hypothetical protein